MCAHVCVPLWVSNLLYGISDAALCPRSCVFLSCRLWASYSLACVSAEPGDVLMSSTASTSLCSRWSPHKLRPSRMLSQTNTRNSRCVYCVCVHAIGSYCGTYVYVCADHKQAGIFTVVRTVWAWWENVLVSTSVCMYVEVTSLPTASNWPHMSACSFLQYVVECICAYRVIWDKEG